MFGNRIWKDFGLGMEAFLGPNWPSEVVSRASVVKYTNEEGAESINYPAPPPALKFSVWGPSVRENQGEPHGPMLPLTGSADFSCSNYLITTRKQSPGPRRQAFFNSMALISKRITPFRRPLEHMRMAADSFLFRKPYARSFGLVSCSSG